MFLVDNIFAWLYKNLLFRIKNMDKSDISKRG